MISDETRKKWVEALRSGEYKQGTGVLRSNESEYCCLGVLCDLDPEYTWKSGGSQNCFYLVSPKDGFATEAELMEWDLEHFGLSNDAQTLLIQLNDDRKETFSAIADVIEKGEGSEKHFPDRLVKI